MSPLGGVQIYERQLVEGTITAPFQETRKVIDMLVTAAESVVYTPFAAVRFHWQRWRGTGCRLLRDFPQVRCVSRLLHTRLTAQNLLNFQNSVGWQWSRAKGVMPREHTLSAELRNCIDPSGSQNLFPVGRNLPSGHSGHFVRSLILLSL